MKLWELFSLLSTLKRLTLDVFGWKVIVYGCAKFLSISQIILNLLERDGENALKYLKVCSLSILICLRKSLFW